MVGIVLIYNMYKYMYIYGCGCLTCNYVTIDWAWTPINLCDTKGITHNGRSQEELDWWLVVGSGCRVVMCCPLSHSWRFLVHLGTPKVSRVGLLLPKYSVLFFCSLVFLSPEELFQPLFLQISILLYTLVNGSTMMEIFHLCIGPSTCQV